MLLATVGVKFADVIAARRLPAPVSAIVLTVKVAARATRPIATNKNVSANTPSAKRRFRSAIGPPPHGASAASANFHR